MKKNLLARGSVIALCTAIACYSTIASAQQVPGSADAGRVDEQVRMPDELIQAAPKIEVREIAIKEAPAGAEKITFPINSLSLEGANAYDRQELETVYKEKLGKTVSLADLYGIAGDLTRKYRNDGYILTQVIVPPQTIEGGTARLQVVEGYVSNVTVQGNDTGAELIRNYAARIQSQGRATNVKDLEHWMLLVNDLPGVSARGVLSPSPTQPGAAELTVITERDSLDGVVGIDNYGSRYLGKTQMNAALSGNNLLGLNEKITGQVAATPLDGLDPELAYVGLNYAQPIFGYGTILDLFASKTLTDPGFNLKQFDVDGKSDVLGIGLRHPFYRSRELNFTGRTTFDYRNVDSNNDIEPTRSDRIRTLRVGGRLEAIDSLIGVGYNIADIEIAHGIDILNASQEDDFVSRPEADPDFYKVNAEFQRLQRLTSSLNLLVGLTGQWANNALYSSEEFGVGGINYGRGYDPSEITGDDGIAGKVEIQWTEPYQLPYFESYQLFGFYDAGKVWNKDATTSDEKNDSLASAGVGVRMNLPMQIDAGAMLALPLTRTPEVEDDSGRVLFTLSKSF